MKSRTSGDFNKINYNNMRKVILTVTVLMNFAAGSNSQGWEVLTSNVSVNLHGVNFIDYNTGYVCGAGGTIIKTTNGGLNWFSLSSGITSLIYDIYFINPQTGYFCGIAGIYKTTNSGVDWFSVYSGAQVNRLSCPSLNIIYAGGQSGVYKSTNAGLNWANTITGYSGLVWGMHFLNDNTGYAMGSEAATKTTSNGGANWGGGLFWGPGNYVFSECHFFNSGSGYVLSSYSQSPPGTGSSGSIYKANSMSSWQSVWSVSSRYLNGMTFKGNDTAYAVVGGWNGTSNEPKILRSTNGGNNWLQQISPVTNQSFSDVYFVDNKYGFAVGRSGVIIKTGTAGIIGINIISNLSPKEFNLSQNYPNPFNPVTKIRFDIPQDVKSETSNVQMIVYDAIGREISKLVDQQLQPGSYEVDWNASAYPSGVYFYRITAGEFTQIRKMILLK